MSVDALSVDWRISMSSARRVAGPQKVLAGNLDPMVLYGSVANIRRAVDECVLQANGKHVLNLGHGVEKDISEEAVETLVTRAREIKL